MRKGHDLIRSAMPIISAAALGVLSAGCIDLVGEYYTPLTDPALADAGTDGGTPAGCDPSKNKDAVADKCGVFVSPSGDDSNPGTTKAKPLKTITAALAKGKIIYACAGATPYTEALVLDKATTIFGALDCTSWVYEASKKTELTAEPDAIPLELAKTAGGTEIHDFAITAADAKTAGVSSIAVVDDQAQLTLANVDVAAGAGAAGAPGAVQMQVMTPATANGKDGADDAMCNVPGLIVGGPGGANTCNGMQTNGGNGGKGIADTNGGPGGDGAPPGAANGGAGQTKTMQCQPGTQGTQGSTGTPGTGARGVGGISASGYQGPAPSPAGNGMPGQGGGGGGGSRQCDVNGMFAGPSGGGGGAGGCEGLPGNPGQSGGSSIGILALSAKLVLTTVTVTTHDGGAGGLGGDGQPGAAGGSAGHAPLSSNACDGGKGGQGGAGGPGGGGAGGHSTGIAIKGGALPDLGSAIISHGKGAPGGAGGDMDMTAQTKGDDGFGCATLDFGKPMSPTACAM